MTTKWKLELLFLVMLLDTQSRAQVGSPPITAYTVDSILYVDGVKYPTVQAAINSLPPSGGTVIVPAGKYPAPTSIPTGTSLRCATWMGCTFTSSSDLAYGSRNGSAYFRMDLWGIVFDFGGTNAGLTLNAMQRSTFAIFLQNTTGDALSLVSVTGTPNPWPSTSFAMNKFDYLGMKNVGEGLVLNGDVNIPSCGSGQTESGGAIFMNAFDYIDIEEITGANGIKFTSGVDTNSFGHVYLQLSSSDVVGNGMILGSRCSTGYGDVDLNHIHYYSVDANSAGYTGNGIVANFSRTVIDDYAPGGDMSSKNALNANAYAALSIGWAQSAPFGVSTPNGSPSPAFQTTNLEVTQQALMANLLPATSVANQYAPPLAWKNNVWDGAASVGETWVCQPSAQHTGIPTFENLGCNYTGPRNNPSWLLNFPITLGLSDSRGRVNIFAPNSSMSADAIHQSPPVSGTLSQATELYCGATSRATQACAKTVEHLPIIAFGDVTLNGTSSQLITKLPFTAATFSCSGSDLTNVAGTVSFNAYMSTSVTVYESGGGTADHLRYLCVGY